MAEKIPLNLISAPLVGQVQTGNNSSQPGNNSATENQTALNTKTVDLKQLSQATNNTVLPVTIQDLRQQKLNAERSSLRNKSMTAMTLAGGMFSVFAGLSKMFLGEDNALAKALDGLTNKVTSLSFTGFGAFGASDATRRKYLPQVIPQVLGMITPWLVKSEDLTMYRGVEVGLTNMAADVEKLSGIGKKGGYQDFGESINVLKSAASKYAQAMKENPFKAALNYESGTAGITAGLVTAFSPLLHILGFKKPASILRQGGGLIQEFASKFNMDNLNKGRYALVTSGGLMTASSFLNLIKEFLPQNTHKAVENFTWAFNLFGKQAQLQAYNSGEMALTQKQNYTLSELPGKMLRAVLGQTNQTESKSASSTKLIEAQSNARQSSSGTTSLRMPSYTRQSFVPRASLATTRSTSSATSSNSANNTATSQLSQITPNKIIQPNKSNLKTRSISGNSFAAVNTRLNIPATYTAANITPIKPPTSLLSPNSISLINTQKVAPALPANNLRPSRIETSTQSRETSTAVN